MRALLPILISFLFSLNSYAQQAEEFVLDQLILKLRSDIQFDLKKTLRNHTFNIPVLDDLNQLYHLNSIQVLGNKNNGRTLLFGFDESMNTQGLIKAYYDTGLFEHVEPNYLRYAHTVKPNVMITPNDDEFDKQWALYNNGYSNLYYAKKDADIKMKEAWEIEQGSSDIIVAILDTGIKTNHPEFHSRIWVNASENNNGSDSDNNGYIDDRRGWNFAYQNNNPTDDHGHGTVMAGLLGANANNEFGFAGVDWNCKIMNCKVLTNFGGGKDSWFIEAIHYAVDNGAHIINMSIGGPQYSLALEEAVNYAYKNNVLVIASTGNSDQNIPNFPASYENTLAVGSTNPDDTRASPFFTNALSGSNYGNYLDIVAPGNYIYGLSYLSNLDYDNIYAGTSLSVPLVAGVASLLLAQNPNRTPDHLKNILIQTADDMVGSAIEDTEGYDIYYGHGRLNAFKALSQYPTATLDADLHNAITIYPNPANNTLIVNGELKGNFITVKTISGQEVIRVKAESDTEYLDITEQEPGMYFIQLYNKQMTLINTQKFSKIK
jgi:subtilisin family serine protease